MKRAGEEVSNQTATNDLRVMVDAGLLTKQGSKRGTFYLASKNLMKVYADLRRERQPITTDHLFDLSEFEKPSQF